jgi:ribosomal protein S18 acetylase RimI-like enzyme
VDRVSPPTKLSLKVRPVVPADEAFLLTLYAGTRADEMALVEWADEERGAFLRQQHDAQMKHYQENFGNARHEIILQEGRPIGRIYVERNDEEIRLLDITILPAERRAGIGTQIMGDLMDEAATAGVPIRFYVWQLNYGALRFYQRLGFNQVGVAGAYLSMEWRAE